LAIERRLSLRHVFGDRGVGREVVGGCLASFDRLIKVVLSRRAFVRGQTLSGLHENSIKLLRRLFAGESDAGHHVVAVKQDSPEPLVCQRKRWQTECVTASPAGRNGVASVTLSGKQTTQQFIEFS